MSDKVCVLGHILQHVIMQPAHVPVKARKARPDASDGDTLPYSVYVTFAGAPFLRRMIMRAISGNAGAADIVLAAYDPPPSEFALSRRLIYILDYFPKSFDKPEDMVLRVKPNDVYLARVYNYDLNSQTRQVITGNVGSPVLKPGMIENGTLSILVIYDSNLSSWEEYDPELLRYTIETARNVVIAIRKWGDNSLDEKYLRFITDDLKEKCIIITTADALRECGVKITLNGSLEQAVNEIVACLDESPIKSRFGHKCSHFVVVFREVLVIQVSKSENGIRCAVHCCPNFKRAIQAEESRYGRMPGRFSIMLTAIVKGLYDHNKKTPDEREDIFERIEMALRQGVAACASYFDKGYASKDGVAPFDALLEAVDFSGNKEKSGLMTLPGREFGISSVRASFGSQGLAGGRQWVRSDFFQENIGEIAKNIIKKGLDEALRDEGSRGRQGNVDDNSYPKATISCPYAEFGDYKTFDAEEARDFYALENLLRKYLGTPDWEKPLSIAVFGKPGSGKNFFVNNIIKNVTKKEVKPLVFNLAQFREISQLTEAFHKIQDQGLTMDSTLAIFLTAVLAN